MQRLHQELGRNRPTSRCATTRGGLYRAYRRAASSMMRVVQIIGARAPLHITVGGQDLLAERRPGTIDAVRAAHGVAMYTENTLTDPEKPGARTRENPAPGLRAR